jgi:hypothetical protein
MSRLRAREWNGVQFIGLGLIVFQAGVRGELRGFLGGTGLGLVLAGWVGYELVSHRAALGEKP